MTLVGGRYKVSKSNTSDGENICCQNKVRERYFVAFDLFFWFPLVYKFFFPKGKCHSFVARKAEMNSETEKTNLVNNRQTDFKSVMLT